MTALIIYASLTVSVSFMCSMLEAALLSITPTEVGLLRKNQIAGSKLLEKLKVDINRPLSSILAVNTAANMIGAAGVGAQVIEVYGDKWLGFASGVLTLVILLFSEILPKTIGARFSQKIAPAGSYLIYGLMIIGYPIVILSERIAALVPHPKEEKDKAKEELIVSAEIHQTQGMIQQNESVVIRNLLTLDRLTVADVMTPRANVLGYQKDRTVSEILENEKSIRYSRLPVYGEDLDDIIGVVHRYKLIEAQWQNHTDIPVGELSSPVYFISQSISVANALDQFIKTKQHLFAVLDTYGSTAGIITLEDAIETLLGEEIIDEYDIEDDVGGRIRLVSPENKKYILLKRSPKE